MCTALLQAREYAESLDNAVWTNQFDNTANRRAHIETTGPEIWAQTGICDVFHSHHLLVLTNLQSVQGCAFPNSVF